MQSAIGQILRRRRPLRVLAVAVGLGTALVDFAIVTYRFDSMNRGALAIAAFVAIVWITDGDRISMGLRLTPKQGWILWIRMSAIIGAAVATCIGIGLGVATLAGKQIPIYTTEPSGIVPRFLDMCFVYPILEEAIYRVAVCVPLVPAVGCWRTIAMNGILFGVLHVAYGNPSPENLVGGFFLSWAYLKSESILIPFILHAGGNFVVLLAQIAGWYVLEIGRAHV